MIESEANILTQQAGITSAQLAKMQATRVFLVVLKSLRESFPKERAMNLLSVESFIQTVKQQLNV